MLTKTDNAVILHKLEASVPVQTVQILKEDVHVLDGNVLLHSLQKIPDTFEELARHLFKRLSNVSMVHFVTYSYKEISIKAQGRLRRGKYNPIKISGSSIKVPRKFQNFLSKDENKRNLLALIRNEWSTQINMLKRSKEHKHKHLLCL